MNFISTWWNKWTRKDLLPAYIKTELHTDWFWPLSYIPRIWTSYCFPMPPKQILGNQVPQGTLIQSNYPMSPAGDSPTKVFLFNSPQPVGPSGTWSIQAVWLGIWIPCFFTFTKDMFGHRLYFNIGCKPDLTTDGKTGWNWGFPETSLTFDPIS